MSKAPWILAIILCLAGAVFGIVMTVMAFRFMEYGRVVFYSVIAIACLEAGIIAFTKLRRQKH